ncbi:uncharacterized protein L969DRAFT_90924 [Mixia osmundae IAM 14324]|uniref:Ketoreductase (KR) domain-containing protein n=1 Tax=Mixia osmundae (strain CBS 9802 / IAM 14324 / JCM 22182 / KY 12970) TaxID=764103 RepID=G7EB68_MIXOS|nr:uncharacterized protein L969DRAFT_90924 [Mixia osmundae IAM 14324]KEI36554.1 hypothetical protein L969DRAFT_90924 [Mixia osmundae IAM 14324]GAB00079.1 hypothetical protein E5Q_06781 [Mixia osmundae IAM 14324]
MAGSLVASKLFNLKGWNTLVTGGATGIGRMIAVTLASNGANVYITGRRKEVLEKTASLYSSDDAVKSAGGSIHAIQCDVQSKKSILEAVADISSKVDFLNLVVANAGIITPSVDIGSDPDSHTADSYSKVMLDQDPTSWDDCFKTNITACFFTAAAFLPLLGKAKTASSSPTKLPGSIITISSMSGITKESQSGQFAYNTSKAGTIQLTELLATELARPHIRVRVNSIAPGYFPSEMTTNSSGEDNKSSLSSEGFMTERGVPYGRPGTERDMAQLLLLFACNEYVTGQTTVIDGGWLLRHA